MSLENIKEQFKKCIEDDALNAKANEIGLDNLEGQIEHGKSLGLIFTLTDIEALTKEMASRVDEQTYFSQLVVTSTVVARGAKTFINMERAQK